MKEIKTELFEEPHEMRISQTATKLREPLIEGTYDS